MWILYAFGSAFFSGITAVLAKCGIHDTNSHVATALRTIVVLIFSWIMVFIVGSFHEIATLSYQTILFWCYQVFRQAHPGYVILELYN